MSPVRLLPDGGEPGGRGEDRLPAVLPRQDPAETHLPGAPGTLPDPHKKGQTQVPNPLLKDVLRASEAEFLARTACSSAEEFEVFKKLLAREEREEPRNHWPGDREEDEDEDEGSTSDEDPEREGRR